MTRRNRLSRSRDFDAVYRQGRSVSTRYLVLYAFQRPDDHEADAPRLGLAVSRQVGDAVERNRLKRVLRSAFADLEAGVPSGRDYVLIARPGLAEAAAAQGHEWVVERLREVFGQAHGDETAGP